MKQKMNAAWPSMWTEARAPMSTAHNGPEKQASSTFTLAICAGGPGPDARSGSHRAGAACDRRQRSLRRTSALTKDQCRAPGRPGNRDHHDEAVGQQQVHRTRPEHGSGRFALPLQPRVADPGAGSRLSTCSGSAPSGSACRATQRSCRRASAVRPISA
jgi:hypothetical protein